MLSFLPLFLSSLFFFLLILLAMSLFLLLYTHVSPLAMSPRSPSCPDGQSLTWSGNSLLRLPDLEVVSHGLRMTLHIHM